MTALIDPSTGKVAIPQLYHYTCEHGMRAITADGGWLRPNQRDGLLWLTDLDVPYRDALGLTSHILSCDRTEHRFEVVMPSWDQTPPWPAVPWKEIRRTKAFVDMAEALEATPGVMPMHWWISSRPLLGRLS